MLKIIGIALAVLVVALLVYADRYRALDSERVRLVRAGVHSVKML